MLARRSHAAPDHGTRRKVHRLALLVHALAERLHLQLLQVSGEMLEARSVGEHRVRPGAQRVAIPDADERHQRGDVVLEGFERNSRVHRVRPGQQLLEALHAERHRDRQPTDDHTE
jgi:hypothetical protein